MYCGHEYTYSNLKFGLSVEPDNKDLAETFKNISPDATTIPGTIDEELKTNPFMRTREKVWDDLGVGEDPVKIMKRLREMKDRFK